LRRYIEANEFPLMGDWYGVTYNKSALSEISYRGLKKREREKLSQECVPLDLPSKENRMDADLYI
jgi:hypothetical protein